MQKVESKMRGICTWTVETACKDPERKEAMSCLWSICEKNSELRGNGKIAPGRITYIQVYSGEKDKENLWDLMD